MADGPSRSAIIDVITVCRGATNTARNAISGALHTRFILRRHPLNKNYILTMLLFFIINKVRSGK
jgi:hypothetical protein